MVIIAIYHYFSPLELFRHINLYSFKFIPMYLVISFLIMGCLVIRWQNILACFGQPVKFWKLFEYKLAGFAISYLTPTMHIGGEPVRAYLLKNHDIALPKAISSVLLDDAIEFSVDVVFGIIGFLLIITHYAISGKATALILGALLVSFFIIGRFFYMHSKGKGSFSATVEFFRLHKFKGIRAVIEKIKLIEENTIFILRWKKGPFLKSFAIAIVLWVLMFFEYYFALRIIGYTPNMMEIFLVMSLVALAYVVPVPAALGVLEAAQISIFLFLGIQVYLAIALTFLIRTRDLIWTLIGLIFVYKHSRPVLRKMFR